MDFLTSHFDHVLAILILIGRLGDVGSTLFVTPTLRLEANPIVRRFKWPAIVLGFLLCATPYLSQPAAVAVAVPSLLVTASNLSRSWMARALGEAEMEAIVMRAAQKGSRRIALAMLWLAGVFLLAAAALLVVISGLDSWGFWFALGLAIYGTALPLHGSLYILRVFHRAAAATAGGAAAA